MVKLFIKECENDFVEVKMKNILLHVLDDIYKLDNDEFQQIGDKKRAWADQIERVQKLTSNEAKTKIKKCLQKYKKKASKWFKKSKS